jgi:hypothetical protein
MNYRVASVLGANNCYGVEEPPAEPLAYQAAAESGTINLRDLSTNTQIFMTPTEVEAVIEALSLALDRCQARSDVPGGTGA